MEIVLKRALHLILGLSGIAQAESFGSWLNRQIERGRWEGIKLSPPPSPAEFEKVANTKTTLFDLYRAHLPPGVKVEQWEAMKLPRALQMPAAEPAAEFYNTHILWALKSGKRVVGFRPVDTSTGCSSGCSPVVFHLALTPEGQVTQLFEEKDRPLRKLGHAPFTDEDRKKALEIAQKLPDGLRDIDGPADLTDDTPYPAQTWTVLKPMLVPNAAYTSYRIYEAALKSLEAIHPEDNASAIDQEREVIMTALQADAANESTVLSKIMATLESKSNAVEARRAALRLLPALVLWKTENPSPGVDPLKWARTAFSRPEYRASRLRAFCRFETLLADSERGLTLLGQIMNTPETWPSCSSESDEALSFLSGQSKKKGEVPPIPNFALQSPSLLKAYAEAAQKAGRESQAHQALAVLRVRFPGLNQGVAAKISAADLKMAEQEYRQELRRELVPATTPFPKLDIKGGKKLATQGKRVFFVFASWCPHCQHTLGELGRRKIPEKLLSRLQLIEAFARPGLGTGGSGLCRESKLPEAICKSLVQAEETPANKEAFRTLSLFTIPRIFVTDVKGRITAFDFKLDFREGHDALRDLTWLIEEIDR